MKKENYAKKSKFAILFRGAPIVLVCVIFVLLIVAHGFRISNGNLEKGKGPGFINTGAMIVQTDPFTGEIITSSDDALTNAPASAPAITEKTATEETPTIPSGEETRGTVNTSSGTESQTKPTTTPVKPTTTKPATTKPTTTKPTTTQPSTTKPTTTKPTTTKPATTQPATTQPTTMQPTTRPATPSNVPCNHLDCDEQVMLDLINQERRKAGVPDVKLDTNLRTVAQVKCKELIGLDYFSHQSPVYGLPFEMVTYFGIKCNKVGENLAMNCSVEAANIALMNSDGHRKNILNPDYTHVGIGAYEGVKGKYYCQMFICAG